MKRESAGQQKRREQGPADCIPPPRCVEPPLEAVEAMLLERSPNEVKCPNSKRLREFGAEVGRSR